MSQVETRSKSHTVSDEKILEKNVTVQQPKFNLCEVAEVYEMLKVLGQCYIKEHTLLALNGDKTGFLKEWHTRVTIKGLDTLIPFAKDMGLTLPFPKSLETREQEIKTALKGISAQVITDGEVLKELKIAGRQIEMCAAQAFLGCTNKELRSVFCDMKTTVGDAYTKTMEHLRETDCFFPIPVVTGFTYMSSGLVERK
jgi:hypothetical protein